MIGMITANHSVIVVDKDWLNEDTFVVKQSTTSLGGGVDVPGAQGLQ